jgi:hypothetical protein
MNNKQRFVLVLGALVLALLVFVWPAKRIEQRDLGSGKLHWWTTETKIDTTQTLIRAGAVVIITAGLTLALSDKK